MFSGSMIFISMNGCRVFLMASNRLLLSLRFTEYFLRISVIILFVSLAFSEELAVKGLKSDGPLAWTNPVLEVQVGLADERGISGWPYFSLFGISGWP